MEIVKTLRRIRGMMITFGVRSLSNRQMASAKKSPLSPSVYKFVKMFSKFKSNCMYISSALQDEFHQNTVFNKGYASIASNALFFVRF